MIERSAADEPARVLVVDDSRTNRLTLQRGVEREGHHVLAVENGRQALDVLRSDQVDTVLLDLEMPEMDGLEVLAHMQQDPALREVPVLVISAVEDIARIAKAIELGAVDVLPKPFEPVLLSVRLRNSLQQRRLRRLEQQYLRQELALRQQEKLVTLGKLAAGLAHEINNPAAAATRTARRLLESLDAALGAAEGDLVLDIDLDPAAAPPLGSIELADREGELAQVLASLGFERAWALAPELAAGGITTEVLSHALLDADQGVAQAALERLCRRSAAMSALAQIVTSVERISDTIAALRRYSYMDRAAMAPVDVRVGLDDTIAILGHKIPPGTTVRREYADDLPAVEGDGGQLNQVWTNLIDNAVQALEDHGFLSVGARQDGHDVLVEVEDDGPGIPAGMLGSVFDPFVTSKSPGDGLGLGLSIAHQIVTEGHHGRITVISEPGRTVFSVRLPLRHNKEQTTVDS